MTPPLKFRIMYALFKLAAGVNNASGKLSMYFVHKMRDMHCGVIVQIDDGPQMPNAQEGQQEKRVYH